jgi:hypothetical protein
MSAGVLVYWSTGACKVREDANFSEKEITMKHINLLKIVLTIAMLVTVCLAAADTGGNVSNLADLSTYAVPFLAALICFLLGRFLKVNVEVQKLIPVLTAIVSACFSTEKETNTAGKPNGVADYDEYRAVIAATKVETALNSGGQSTLKKVFGTAVDAVKFVFPLIKPVVKLLK